MIDEGSIEDLIRGRLRSAPASWGSRADGLAALDRAGRVVSARRRRQSIGMTLGVVFVLVVGVFAGARLATPGPRVADDLRVLTAIDDWPARGDRALDATFINQAKQAIISQSAQAHQQATVDRVLYAGTLAGQTPGAGTAVVVATGTAGGQAVVIYASTLLATSGQTGVNGGLMLRSLIPVDLQKRLRSVGFAQPMRPGDSLHPSSMTSTLVMSLVAPDVAHAHLTSSVIDGNMTDSPDGDKVVNDGLVVDTTFAGVGPWNSTIVTDGTTDESANVIGGALTDPVVINGVLRTTDQSLIVTTTSSAGTQLRIGEVVATKAGVVGRISQITKAGAVVDTNLASLSDNGILVTSFDSNYSGKLVSSAGSLAFQVSEATPEGVNRVVVQVAGTSAFLSIGTRSGAVPASPSMPLLRSVSPQDLPASVPVIIAAAQS